MGLLQKNQANWWPDVDTLERAKKAVIAGYVAAFFIAAISAIYGIISVYNGKSFYETDLVDSLIYVIIGWRIIKFSRTWSVIGVIVTIVEKGYMYLNSQNTIHLFFGLMFTLMFISAVRGTFSYYDITHKEVEVQPVDSSNLTDV